MRIGLVRRTPVSGALSAFAFVMLIGAGVGIPLALAMSWATDGGVSFWASLVTVVIVSAVVLAWASSSSRKIGR